MKPTIYKSDAEVTCPSCNSISYGTLGRASRNKHNSSKDCALCGGTRKVTLDIAVRFASAMNGAGNQVTARPVRQSDPWSVR